MSSKDEEAGMELIFVRENSISQQEKIKAFWKFLDTHDYLQAHKGTLEHESPSETETLTLSVEKIMEEKDVWRKGLKVFQQLGLDKTALAADNKCRLCHRTIQCEDSVDTVTQMYDELNADMKAFEQRQETRGSNRGKTGTAN